MEFKLDRTAFQASSLSKKIHYGEIYQNKTTQELLEIAAYLNSLAYGYPIDTPQKMDKTVFSVRSRK